MKIYLICKNCKRRVSKLLTEQEMSFEKLVPCKTEVPLLGKGEYAFDENKNIYTSISDKYGLVYHKDRSRFVGCCGASPEGFPNLKCYHCKTDIAREVTDCCSPHYIKFFNENFEFSNDYLDYILAFEKLNLSEQQQQEFDTLLLYGQTEGLDNVLKEMLKN